MSALWWLVIMIDYHGTAIQSIPMDSEKVCYEAISKMYPETDKKYIKTSMYCIKGR